MLRDLSAKVGVPLVVLKWNEETSSWGKLRGPTEELPMVPARMGENCGAALAKPMNVCHCRPTRQSGKKMTMSA